MLTAERLRELLHYDPETGVFTRRAIGKGRKPGRVAGTKHVSGYIHIKVDDRMYMAHRLAWLYVHGSWPDHEIDHRNRRRNDNRISNLRAATRAENTQNKAHARADSASGLMGVRFEPDRSTWRATITLNGRRRHLGRFSTAEAAHAAYVAAKAEIHPFMEERHDGPRATDSVRP